MDKPRAPRPRVISKVQLRSTYKDNPSIPMWSVAEKLGCTMQTVRNSLRRFGIKRPAQNVLSDAHKAARVRFARDFRDLNFSHTIFSDERSFQSSKQGRRHLWRVNKTRNEPQNKSGRVSVNMWAWMSASGPGELVYIPERANRASYLELLKDTMLPTVRVVYPQNEVPEFVFIHEECPIHSCRLVQDWIQQQPEIRPVQWPSRSPDLNPMENVWGMMVKRWDARSERTKDAFVAHVDQIWDSLRGSDLCETLVNSMRSRCDAVIDANGALTKY